MTKKGSICNYLRELFNVFKHFELSVLFQEAKQVLAILKTKQKGIVSLQNEAGN
eukprot:UN01812